jgi:hypothetical protein
MQSTRVRPRPETPPVATPPAAPPRRSKRWIAWTALGVAGFGALAYFLGPLAIASSIKSKTQETLARQLDATVSIDEVTFRWSGKTTLHRLRATRDRSPSMSLSADRIIADLSPLRAITGTYDGTIDVFRPTLVLDRSAGPGQPAPREKKKEAPGSSASFKLAIVLREGTVRITEAGRPSVTLRDLTIDENVSSLGQGRTLVQGKVSAREDRAGEQAVSLSNDVTATPGGVEVRKVDLQSPFLRGHLEGQILRSGSDIEAKDFAGSFRYLPEELGRVLSPWLPGRLEGKEEKSLEFRVTGKATTSNLAGSLRGLRGTIRCELGRLILPGVTLSGSVSAESDGERLTLQAPLELNQGQASIRASSDSNASLRFDVETKGVRAGVEMGPLLGRINPLLHVARGTLEGAIDLTLSGSWEPQGRGAQAILQSIRADGSIAIRELRLEGSPLATLILSTLGEGGVMEGELQKSAVSFDAGRCRYLDMAFRLGHHAIRFSGEVDVITGELKLLAAVPVTERLAGRHSALRGHAGKTIQVPVEGTLEAPRLNLERALGHLTEDSLKEGLEKKAEDLLNEFFKKDRR